MERLDNLAHGYGTNMLQGAKRDFFLTTLHWVNIVGPRMARRCRPLHIRGQTLILETVSKSWAEVIQRHQDDLIPLIHQKIPESTIKTIECIIRYRPDSGEKSFPPSPETPLPEPYEQQLQEMASSIPDPVLRRRVIHIYRRTWWRAHVPS